MLLRQSQFKSELYNGHRLDQALPSTMDRRYHPSGQMLSTASTGYERIFEEGHDMVSTYPTKAFGVILVSDYSHNSG